MKILKICIAGLMLFALTGCNANAAKIGVVDLARAINESNQGKAANAQLKALIQSKQDELKLKAKAVEDLRKSVQKGSSATAKKADEAKLAKAEADYQGLLASSTAEVKEKAAELRNPLLQKLKKVIDAMGRKGNFQVILVNTDVVYYQKTIDITDQVIKRFNQTSGAKK